jgi:carboxypeptidase PM20D1
VETVLEHVMRVVGDSRVDVKISGRFSAEPSPVSSTDSENFRMLEQAIRRVVPQTLVAPYLVVVVTDARYYIGMTRNVYRFLPLQLTPADLQLVHGPDERIGIRNYEQAIDIYRQIIVGMASQTRE